MRLIKDIQTTPGKGPAKRPHGKPAPANGRTNGKRSFNPAAAAQRRSGGTNIDGIGRRHTTPARSHTATRLADISARIEQKIVLQPIIDQKRSPLILPTRSTIRTRNFIFQNSVIAIIAIVMAYSSVAGQVIIGAYLIFGLLLKFDSRYSFGAALIFLIGIPFFQIIGQTGVSENSAIYAYEMLVVGVIQAIIESFRDDGDTAQSTRGTGVAH